MDGPIRYTTSADGTSIAWRQFGSGDVDLVWLAGFVGHLEVAFEQPLVQRFFERLGAFARVLAFDKRGQGLSDRPDRAATMEEHADDALAVMDAANVERPTLVGVSEGGPAAIVCAAAHPDRISKLVLYGTYARLLYDADYPDGIPLASLDRMRDRSIPCPHRSMDPQTIPRTETFGAVWSFTTTQRQPSPDRNRMADRRPIPQGEAVSGSRGCGCGQGRAARSTPPPPR